MNIKDELLVEHSKAQSQKIATYIGKDTEKFTELIQLLLSDDYRVVQRAAWVLSHCFDAHPALLYPHLPTLIAQLDKPKPDAVKRNILRSLAVVDLTQLSEAALGSLVDLSFRLLQSPNQPVAVKVHAMTVLANACQIEPDLAEELKLSIEEQLPYSSAGFKSRGKKLLKLLGAYMI